jgi:type III secretion system HrpB7-like protein
MSAAAIGKWRAIVAAKTRRRERIEEEAACDRRALAEREAARDAARREVEQAQARCGAHADGMAARFRGAAALSVPDYVRHENWRVALKDALDAARKEEQKAAGAVERHQERVRAAEARLARAGAALDRCRARLDEVRRAAAHAAELAADEEAVDNLLARRYASKR